MLISLQSLSHRFKPNSRYFNRFFCRENSSLDKILILFVFQPAVENLCSWLPK
ncbi:hypothetical protein LEP1GSC194_4208 [Leptospira alstonii serovar Sichuan str. 79601]|uniref:Uncharacterized protein n=1 Tax=Leptospira alstonii serovar Sichuan str. 79601 TaxID=1218565 RepID=M6D5Y0_9LEPT|nr:hypothetical protein LEP1GSC194_4208 [Leptospira alstonii serovar Sichuan str. 79601]